MKNQKLFMVIKIMAILLFSIITTTITQAQTPEFGCCCDTRISPATGAIDTKTNCNNQGRQFISLTTPTATISDFYCDKLCQPTIPITPLPTQQCTQAKAPTDFTTTPVKGTLAIKLEFAIPCPANYVKIARCEGTTCTNFQQIDLIQPQQFYIDQSPTLKWNTDYTYQITARYTLLGDSEATIKIINTGDIECGYNYDYNKFCIDQNYYARYEEYLKINGYTTKGQIRTPADFQRAFDTVAGNLFQQKFNNAYTCDPNNKISQPALTCKTGEYCISNQNVASCINTTNPCIDQTNVFGLFSTIQNCEYKANTQEKKYCFFDKSKSTIDTCYACNSRMNCYDYKSKGACERNNCGIGQCTWKQTFADISAGACIDERFNNCQLCTSTGTTTATNTNAYNNVFDQCTQEKSQALSTTKYPCFYQDVTPTGQTAATTCDTITCKEYKTKQQCAANLTYGVTLNQDNSIATPSKDICNIKMCQWSETKGCVKNAQGKNENEPIWPDCAITDKNCEKDYFPPETTIIPTGVSGRTDFLLIKVQDKTNKTTPLTIKQGQQESYINYTTYICTYPEGGTPCTKFNETNATTLNLNDETLQLQDHKLKELSKLTEGKNKIRYYTKDPNKNLEVIKETTFSACKNCAGPQIIDFTIKNSKLINKTYYTADNMPKITVRFNKQAQITTATINKSTIYTPLTQTPTNPSTEYTITPTSTQQALIQGPYTFTINAKDTKENYMDESYVQPFYVKTSKATVQITPPDKETFTKTTIPITLNFSEEVELKDAIIQEEIYATDYIKKYTNTKITNKLSTKNKKFYTGNATLITDGQKTIKIYAEDITGALITAESIFYINTKAPQIIMIKPRWGIAPTYTFPIQIETTLSRGKTNPPQVTCKWVYDTSNAPNPVGWTQFNNFETEYDNKHTITNFNKISNNDTTKHNFHVYCQDNKGNTTQKTFQISVDPTPPEIISAFTAPEIIREETQPSSGQYLTTFKIQTDKKTFCKYSPETKIITDMGGLFPGYDETPNEVNIADIIVDEQKKYTYYVNCETVSGVPAQTKEITFTVNTKDTLSAKSTTKAGFNTTSAILAIESNKKAYCYYSTNKESLVDCIGPCVNTTTNHLQPLPGLAQGSYVYYAKCIKTIGNETSQLLTINFTVDTTLPVMDYVDDDGVLPEEPQISPYKDKIYVGFKGNDTETGISQYLVAIEETGTENYALNWKPSTHLDGEKFFIPELGTITLKDKQKYIIHVKPVNKIGTTGAEMKSDGVTTDFSKKAPDKLNGEKCAKDFECISNYCANGICTKATCTDKIFNGIETDKDCGGPDCDKCQQDQRCRPTDCITGLTCNYGICTNAGPCFDAILTTTGIDSETDIDCGGACAQKCDEDKKCRQTTDCQEGLSCIQNTCKNSDKYDSDKDGVPNDKDKCPETPTGMKVDEDGCADIQKFSIGDEIPDSWRLKYFKCIDCPESAADADPDNDGITNIEEYRLGSNPLDPTDPGQRKGFWSILLWVLLILLIIGGIGLGAYALYEHYQPKIFNWPIFKKITKPTLKPTIKNYSQPLKTTSTPIKTTEEKTKQTKTALTKPLDTLRKLLKTQTTKTTPAEDKEWKTIEQLKQEASKTKQTRETKTEPTSLFQKIRRAQQKQPEQQKSEEYVSLEELQTQQKIKGQEKLFNKIKQINPEEQTKRAINKTLTPQTTFQQLKKITTPQNKIGREISSEKQEKTKQKIIETTKTQIKPAFEKLQQVALANLPPSEKAELIKKLKLLRENKLNQKEIEELLKKLKITSQYYKTNKEELQKQLKQWLKQK